MADPIIELQELLNRASGPGKIGPDKPLETRLYGANGQPIGTAGNPLQVKAHDTDTALGQIKDALGPLATETKLEAVRLLLSALVDKDFATQATLVQVLSKLSDDPSTAANQDAAKAVLNTISDKVATDASLTQAVQKLTELLTRLDKKLKVEFEEPQEVQVKGSIDVLGEITSNTVIPAGQTLELISRERREGYREVRGAVYLSATDSRGNYRLRVRLLQPHSNQNNPVGFAYLKTFENEYYGHGRTEDINSPRWCVEIVNDNDFDATLVSAVILGVK